MSKGSGGVRPLATKQIPAREKEYRDLLASGEYGDSYFSPAGGYVVAEKSVKMHSAEEWEAAIALADNGYRVTLLDEQNDKNAIYIKKKGKKVKKFRDGDLTSFGVYEQKTPSGKGSENFIGVLRHARDKNAKIALAYQKAGKHTRSEIEKAISDFEAQSRYRFKEIIVVTRDGMIHRHFHNTKKG